MSNNRDKWSTGDKLLMIALGILVVWIGVGVVVGTWAIISGSVVMPWI